MTHEDAVALVEAIKSIDRALSAIMFILAMMSVAITFK